MTASLEYKDSDTVDDGGSQGPVHLPLPQGRVDQEVGDEDPQGPFHGKEDDAKRSGGGPWEPPRHDSGRGTQEDEEGREHDGQYDDLHDERHQRQSSSRFEVGLGLRENGRLHAPAQAGGYKNTLKVWYRGINRGTRLGFGPKSLLVGRGWATNHGNLWMTIASYNM